MGRYVFTDEDLRQIADHGLNVNEVQRQLGMFEMPPPYQTLLGPCTTGDGIKLIEGEKVKELVKSYELEARKGRCLKFVPASGAASRMFKTLLKYLNRKKEMNGSAIANEAKARQKDDMEILKFVNGFRQFAFFNDLKTVISEKELNIDRLMDQGQFTDIVCFLVNESGLNYAHLPKGLLKFHAYPEGNRTCFEEHLVEAVYYATDKNGACRLHFTVSQEHLAGFRNLLKKIRPIYEQRHEVSLRVDFSFQKKSTDTLAVDLENRPFRDKDGRLVFRPGGHGALIENLNDLQGDIIFLKNIDNVAPDRLKPETIKWKKILGGYLISMQHQLFGYVKKLSSGHLERDLIDRIVSFMKNEIHLSMPPFSKNTPPGEIKAMLLEKLNRPIRVCGMVRNVKEPGGGPFWVKDQIGERSLQIVEKAQIDPDSEEQQAILSSSTHFNPVDLVCGVRDWQGRSFDLRRYMDPNAVLISQKSKEGRDLKALERPGLWNGAMAQWITIFVEVPAMTFNPVKTVNDLLRDAHQQG